MHSRPCVNAGEDEESGARSVLDSFQAHLVVLQLVQQRRLHASRKATRLKVHAANLCAQRNGHGIRQTFREPRRRI